MKKILSLSMVIVGCMMGASFASGRDLINYWGIKASPYSAIICGIVVFVISLIFLNVGNKVNSKNISDVNIQLVGKVHVVIDVFLLANSFILLSVLLSAMDTLGGIFFNLTPLYSVVVAVIIGVILIKFRGGLMGYSRFVMPIVVIAIISTCIICLKNSSLDFGGAVARPYLVVVYVCMNMMLAGASLTTKGKLTKKEMLLSSSVAGVIITLFVFGILATINAYGEFNSSMPLLLIVRKISPFLGGLMTFIFFISIFTAIMSTVDNLSDWFDNVIFDNKNYSVIMVVITAITFSFLGFTKFIAVLFPLIGTIGIFYVVLCIVYLIRQSRFPIFFNSFLKKRNTTIHNSSQKT